MGFKLTLSKPIWVVVDTAVRLCQFHNLLYNLLAVTTIIFVFVLSLRKTYLESYVSTQNWHTVIPLGNWKILALEGLCGVCQI